MTQMTNPMMKVTVLAARKVFRSCTSSRLWVVVLLLLVVNPVFSGYSWGNPSRDWSQPDDDKTTPKFETAKSSITALVGQPVYMSCRVRNLGDRVVSWIRTRDLHILTWGTMTYTTDSRFEALHKPESEEWTLRIMSAQPRDQGKYECQVNTDPKLNFAVLLIVKETDMRDSPWHETSPTSSEDGLGIPATGWSHPCILVNGFIVCSIRKLSARITGPAEQYVHQGSTVTLTCEVPAPYSQGTRPPRVVDWFHSDRLVSIQADRGGISIDTEKTDFQTTSKLTVAGVTHRDAGNYTCRPADTRPALVTLVVIEGEHTEAMQRDDTPSQAPCVSRLPLQQEIFLFLFLIILQISATR